VDQRPIVLYLTRNSLSAIAIDTDLVVTLDRNATNYRSVTRFLREPNCPSSSPLTTFSEGKPGFDDSDQAILFALTEQSFPSIRQLSEFTCLPSTTIYRRLTQSLGFHVRHLRSVPRLLTKAQKSNRVELSRQFLSMLKIQRVRC
jgi:hypothetical protein